MVISAGIVGSSFGIQIITAIIPVFNTITLLLHTID